MTKKFNTAIVLIVVLGFFLSIILLGSGLVFDGKDSGFAANSSANLTAEAETTASEVEYDGQIYNEIIGVSYQYKFILDSNNRAIITWINCDYQYVIVPSRVYKFNSTESYSVIGIKAGIFDGEDDIIAISLPESIILEDEKSLFTTYNEAITIYVWGNSPIKYSNGSLANINAKVFYNSVLIENNGIIYLADGKSFKAKAVYSYSASYEQNITDQVTYTDNLKNKYTFEVISYDITTYAYYEGEVYPEQSVNSGLYKYIIDNKGNAVITWWNYTIPHIIVPKTITAKNNTVYTVHAIKGGIFDNFTELSTLSLPDSIFIEYGKNLFTEFNNKVKVYCSGSTVLRWDSTSTQATANASLTYRSNVYENNGLFYLVNEADKCATLIGVINNYLSVNDYPYLNRNLVISSLINPNNECFDKIIVTKIGDDAFKFANSRERESIISVTIPESVTEIGDYAFAYCEDMQILFEGENNFNLTKIGNYAFMNSKAKLPESDIFRNVEIIGNRAFENYQLLKTDDFSSLIYLGEGAFLNAKTEGDILFDGTNFPNLKEIGDYAFSEFQSFGDNVFFLTAEKIGEYAFSLTNIKLIKLNINTISKGLFQNCIFLESFYNELDNIANKRITIEDEAFFNCISLQGAFFDNTETLEYDRSFFSNLNLDFYGLVEFLENNRRITNSNIVSIGKSAFQNCISLSHVGTHNTYDMGIVDLRWTNYLGENAFAVCQSLNRIIFGNFLKVIPDFAFYYCINLLGIMFSSQDLEAIKRYEIKFNLGVNTSVTEIGEFAFYFAGYAKPGVTQYCKTEFESVKQIDEFAFYGCQLVSELVFNDIKSIGEEAFSFSSLQKIELNGLQEIDSLAFSNSELNRIYIKSYYSKLTLGDNPFFNCPNLTIDNLVFNMPDKGIELKNNMLIKNGNTVVAIFELNYNRDQLQSVNDQNYMHINFDENINYIGNYVFVDLESAGNIIIPDNIQKIEENAFFGNEDFGTLIFISEDSPCINNLPLVESYKVISSNSGLQIEITTGKHYKYNLLGLVSIMSEIYDSQWLYYIDKNNQAVILMLLYSTDYYDIKIPDYLGGKKVAYIEDCAFSGCDQLQFVGLPNYLKTGGVTSRTFDNCPNLRWVYDRADCYMHSENYIYSNFNGTSPYTAIGGVIYEKVTYINEEGKNDTGLKLIYVPRSISKRLWFEDSYIGIKIRYPSAYKTELKISNQVIDDKVESEESEEGKIYKVTAQGVEPGAMHNLKYVEVVHLPNGFPYFGEEGAEDLKEYYFKGCRDDLKVFNDSNYDIRIETGWIQFAIDSILGLFLFQRTTYSYTKKQKNIESYQTILYDLDTAYDEVIAKFAKLDDDEDWFTAWLTVLTVIDNGMYKDSQIDMIKGLQDDICDKIAKEVKHLPTKETVAPSGMLDVIVNTLKGDNILCEFVNLIKQIPNITDKLSKVLFILNFPGIKQIINYISDVFVWIIEKIGELFNNTVLQFVNNRHIELFLRTLSIGGIVALLFDLCDGIIDGYFDVSLKDGWFYKLELRTQNLNKRKKGEISESAKWFLITMGDTYYDSSFQDYLINL